MNETQAMNEKNRDLWNAIFFWRRKTRALCNYKLSILGRIADGETEAHRLRKLPRVTWVVSRRKCWLSQPITIHQHSSRRKGVPGRARHRTAAVSWGPCSEGPHFRLTRAQQQIIPTGWHQLQSAWTRWDMGLDEGSKGIFFWGGGRSPGFALFTQHPALIWLLVTRYMFMWLQGSREQNRDQSHWSSCLTFRL